MNTTALHAVPVAYTTAADLAHALYRWAKPGEANGFTARPYNPYDSRDGLWWLVPTTEWPAYNRGKFTVLPLNEEFGAEQAPVLVGLTVEKGAGPGVLAKETYVMRPAWVWNPFFEAMLSGEVDKLASRLVVRTGVPLTVAVRIRYINLKSDLQERGKRAPQSFWLAQHDGWALSTHFESFELPDTEEIKGSPNLREMARFLASLEKLDWLWVDVYLGVCVELGRPAEAWPVERLWREALQPWRKWFV